MKWNVVYLVWISCNLRRNLRAPDPQDLVYQQECQGHGHYTDDKWVKLRLKSPTTQLFVQQLVKSNDKEPPKVRITDPVHIIDLMNCPLTKGHYCGKHIQVMTSSWWQLILGQIWKPAVKSTWLAVMRITKHGYRVSLCKITELVNHRSFYHSNEWAQIFSTYYVNNVARVAMI